MINFQQQIPKNAKTLRRNPVMITQKCINPQYQILKTLFFLWRIWRWDVKRYSVTNIIYSMSYWPYGRPQWQYLRSWLLTRSREIINNLLYGVLYWWDIEIHSGTSQIEPKIIYPVKEFIYELPTDIHPLVVAIW